MGIKGLWKVIDDKGCRREVPTRDVNSLIRTEKCRVAADAFHMCYKYFSAEWLKAASEEVYDQRYMIRCAVDRFLETAEIFRSSRMEMVLCLDGDRNKDKLSTSQRTDIREENYREIVQLYQETRHLFGNEPDRLAPFVFLENYGYVLEGHKAEVVNEDYLSREEVAFANVERMKKLLRTTVFYPKRFIDQILDEVAKTGVEICIVKAISEGEKLCTILVNLGYCQAVFSGDSDSIVLGTRCVIRSISRQTSTLYFYEEILDKLGLDDMQFLSMCIGIGSDFSQGAPGLGPVKCDSEVRKDGFDLQKFNLAYCGVPRANVCVRAFRISEEEMNAVMNGLVLRGSSHC